MHTSLTGLAEKRKSCRDILCTMHMGQVCMAGSYVKSSPSTNYTSLSSRSLKGSVEVDMWKRIPESRETVKVRMAGRFIQLRRVTDLRMSVFC